MKTRAGKQRIDLLLVDRGLAPSREKAQALILAGSVTVNRQRVDKCGQTVAADASIEVAAGMPYVSRGGFKLAGALDHFHVDVAGRVCLDVGASTGGFTDCLLQRGAARVYAFDVGEGQLDWKLRNDARVIVREGVNARFLAPTDLPEKVDLVVCDVSFISVTLILPTLPALMRESAEMVILVKPQFEAGRGEVGKGGIVRDPEVHRAACEKVLAVAQALGFRGEIIDSPITGAEGNKEFLLYATH